MNLRVLFITGMLFLAGCASDKTIIQYQAKTDFSKIKTYSLFERSSSFTEQQNISDMLRNSIELAIEKEFDHQGFKYKKSDEADVMIAYVLTGIAINKPFTPNSQLKMCASCKSAESHKPQPSYSSNDQKKMKNRQLERADNERNIGALVLNIMDTKTLRTLWQSEYPLDVENDDNSADMQNKIKLAVSEMMKLYPTNIPAR